jgi:hypothetical protein
MGVHHTVGCSRSGGHKRFDILATMRVLLGLTVCLTVSLAPAEAQRGAAPTRGARVSRSIACAADLGAGIKTHRAFCDVIIASAPADSVALSVPPHSGAATLFFDLHNRFAVPALSVPPALAFARQEAVVAVVGPSGAVIGRAAVEREFRSAADLFDQLDGGGRPGGVKAVAPGPPEQVRFTVPAGISTVGIVGVQVKVLTRAGEQTFDSPGRPVAMVSNVRLEYR